jgi:hypothetical protein
MRDLHQTAGLDKSKGPRFKIRETGIWNMCFLIHK